MNKSEESQTHAARASVKKSAPSTIYHRAHLTPMPSLAIPSQPFHSRFHPQFEVPRPWSHPRTPGSFLCHHLVGGTPTAGVPHCQSRRPNLSIYMRYIRSHVEISVVGPIWGTECVFKMKYSALTQKCIIPLFALGMVTMPRGWSIFSTNSLYMPVL